MSNPAGTRFLDQVLGTYRIDSILATLLLAAFYLSVQINPDFQKIVLDFSSVLARCSCYICYTARRRDLFSIRL